MTEPHSPESEGPLSQWLDDELADAPKVRESTLGPQIDADQIATELVVHGLLKDVALKSDSQDQQRIDNVLMAIKAGNLSAMTSRTRSRIAITGILLATAACLFIMVSIFRPTTANATDALERLIHSVSQSIDRAYRLSVLEEYSQSRRPRNLPDEKWNVKFEDELDGAMLHVGGVNRYVFVRTLKDGRKRVSGCDGKESWAFREDSPIHVSQELARYRGGLPGQQQNLGFTDLFSQLTALRDRYNIELASISVDVPGARMQRLIGARKSREVRGPKSVEIDFDSDNGTIHRMFLDGLPRGQGGPKSVEFNLVSQDDVANEFYSHGSHHSSNRRIKVEGPRK